MSLVVGHCKGKKLLENAIKKEEVISELQDEYYVRCHSFYMGDGSLGSSAPRLLSLIK